MDTRVTRTISVGISELMHLSYEDCLNLFDSRFLLPEEEEEAKFLSDISWEAIGIVGKSGEKNTLLLNVTANIESGDECEEIEGDNRI